MGSGASPGPAGAPSLPGSRLARAARLPCHVPRPRGTPPVLPGSYGANKKVAAFVGTSRAAQTFARPSSHTSPAPACPPTLTRRSSNCFSTSFQKGVPGSGASSLRPQCRLRRACGRRWRGPGSGSGVSGKKGRGGSYSKGTAHAVATMLPARERGAAMRAPSSVAPSPGICHLALRQAIGEVSVEVGQDLRGAGRKGRKGRAERAALSAGAARGGGPCTLRQCCKGQQQQVSFTHILGRPGICVLHIWRAAAPQAGRRSEAAAAGDQAPGVCTAAAACCRAQLRALQACGARRFSPC